MLPWFTIIVNSCKIIQLIHFRLIFCRVAREAAAPGKLNQTYTAKLLFHQSPNRHSDWTVTVVTIDNRQQHGDYTFPLRAQSPFCWQLLMVTRLQCHCTITVLYLLLCLIGDWLNMSFAVYISFVLNRKYNCEQMLHQISMVDGSFNIHCKQRGSKSTISLPQLWGFCDNTVMMQWKHVGLSK